MIDMRTLFDHEDYEKNVDQFKISNCDWGVFKELHKNVSNNKCPICEVDLVETVNHIYSGTIDHFRPKGSGMYPYLKCEPKNYILMCNLCNTRYKESKFPLVDESKRATNAKKIEETIEEKPLLFNPAEEEPLFFFELVFRKTEVGNILELKRKKTISKGSYDYKRCEMMINLFGLGYIHKYNHPEPHEETKKFRVDILTAHYETFINLAIAIKENDKKSFALILSDENRKNMLEQYGFFQFLIKKQFSIC
jgi:hypothetical protein